MKRKTRDIVIATKSLTYGFTVGILFSLILVLSIRYATKITDMCPQDGCGAMFTRVVHAKEYVNLSVKEYVLVEGMRTFGADEVGALEELLNHESHFDPYAVNPTSGACGIFQALPCSKMKCQNGDAACQVKWGMSYIKSRYGSPKKALEFWNARAKESDSGRHGWY